MAPDEYRSSAKRVQCQGAREGSLGIGSAQRARVLEDGVSPSEDIVCRRRRQVERAPVSVRQKWFAVVARLHRLLQGVCPACTKAQAKSGQ